MLRTPRTRLAAMGLAFAWYASVARADDVLRIEAAQLDRPTLVALGVQLLIQGDDNYNASVRMRYRKSGTSTWRVAMPLFRVHPEVVTGRTVPTQFAGSIFDLLPGQSYEIELHAVDSDGNVDQVIGLTGTTREVPSDDPRAPTPRSVSDEQGLRAALAAAQAGDVITLADGTYAGTFALQASGTADQPIVIRGTSRDGTILDGGGCTDCNIFEVYGSFVHIEQLTLAHATRALRFQGTGTEGNVVRRVHVRDTTLGLGSSPDQKDFYLCDNLLEGRLSWPAVWADDNGAHANDDGIHVQGSGHVVCHNRISGYGDAMKTEQDGARAVDFYGNEITFSYDNGLELDGSEGNVRAFRNRFTNTYATLSYQPIYGGPAYTFRNVVVNVVNEQLKFHARGTTPPEEPSGVLIYHNTFVSPVNALANHATAVSHHFVLQNNLFITAPDANGRAIDWSGGVDDGTFDYNGYYPDGIFDFTWGSLGYVKYANLAQARAALGIEMHGVLLTVPLFEMGLTAPATYTTRLEPADVTLSSASSAIDRGLVLANLNDDYRGSAPDLGALEQGCPVPTYGMRPAGVDERNEFIACGAGTAADAGAGDDGGQFAPPNGNAGARAAVTGEAGAADSAGAQTVHGSCGCAIVRGSAPSCVAPLVLLALVSRRRRAPPPGAAAQAGDAARGGWQTGWRLSRLPPRRDQPR